jgi:UDP-N-acetylmuramoyl-tripeptide--D-alanyl-D-alanine ligase
MNVSELYAFFRCHPVITTDSRTCCRGSIFFALRGPSFDGNAYAGEALRRGCVRAVIDDPSVRNDERMILVRNTLETLQQLAALHRQTLGIPVIGITGTNGKTTTRELLTAVLSQKYRTLATSGNLNNHLGVPLTLLRLSEADQIAVIEMGASHPGEIRALAQIARPDYGLITNIGRAHLESFGSREGVVKTKAELYEFLRPACGKIFINRDDACLTEIAGTLEQIAYGTLPAAGVGAARRPALVEGRVTGLSPCLSLQWRQSSRTTATLHSLTTRLAGGYNLTNVLAAITVGIYFSLSPEQINAAIAAYEPANNRSQWKKTAANTLLLDAYNANPDSMKAALENFAALDVSPKAVILGDMRELGDQAPGLHEEVVRQIRAYDFEKVLLCGELFAGAAGKAYASFPQADDLAGYLEKEPLKGFHILLKGSRGIHLEKAVDKL